MSNKYKEYEFNRSEEYLEDSIFGELNQSFLKEFINEGFVVFSYSSGSTLNGIKHSGEIDNDIYHDPIKLENLITTIKNKYSDNLPNRDTVYRFKTRDLTLIVNYSSVEKYSFYVNINGVVKRNMEDELSNISDSDSNNLKSASKNMELSSKVDYAVHRLKHETNKLCNDLGLSGNSSLQLIILSELTRHYTEELEKEISDSAVKWDVTSTISESIDD